MAKVDVKMPEDFLLKFSRLQSNTDAVAEKVLEAGAEVVYQKVSSNLSSVVAVHRGTGIITGRYARKDGQAGQPQYQNRFCGTPFRWQKQRHDRQHPGVRETWAARKAFFEACQICVPFCLYCGDAGEIR